jgi:hypothetical protein
MIAPTSRRRKGRDRRTTKPPKSIDFGDVFQEKACWLTDSLGNFTTKPNFGQGRAVVSDDKAYS